MRRCEVIEVRNVEVVLGYGCSNEARQTCIDCGSAVCDTHSSPCGVCHVVFCPACLMVHWLEHRKSAMPERRKKARRMPDGHSEAGIF
jgi:hypothetical protein